LWYNSSVTEGIELIINKTKTTLIISVIFALVVSLVFTIPKPAKADQLDQQIAALNKKVRDATALADAKKSEVNTLKGKIASIEAEISAAQNQLDLTNLEIRKTQATIEKNNQEMERQKEILKENLRMIYKQGSISPLEVVASSKNLSDFVAQQQYLGAIKKKVDDNLDKIEQLKKELDQKKGQLNAQSQQQKEVVDGIAAKKAEQASILARTQGEEANYRNVIKEDNAKIAELKRQQAAIISSYSSNVQYGGSGGYPWANAPFPNSIPDPWGMYQRQCVSYTAWKVASSGRYMPYWGGRGNANQWDDNARAAGIPVDGNPRVGDVAVNNSGYFGHVMYVEAILGNGKVRVSQYNAGWDGRYSISDVSIAGLQFIHF
jgi:peptidoglycan hydrolase CwlO-like protein